MTDVLLYLCKWHFVCISSHPFCCGLASPKHNENVLHMKRSFFIKWSHASKYIQKYQDYYYKLLSLKMLLVNWHWIRKILFKRKLKWEDVAWFKIYIYKQIINYLKFIHFFCSLARIFHHRKTGDDMNFRHLSWHWTTQIEQTWPSRNCRYAAILISLNIKPYIRSYTVLQPCICYLYIPVNLN